MVPQQSCDRRVTPEYIEESLMDAENLLKFASEKGMDIDPQTRSAILHARADLSTGIDENATADLLLALSKLAAQANPVTAESLSECRKTLRVRRPYQRFSIGLAVIVIGYSIASLMASSIAESIRNDVTVANGLAVKLNAEFVPIADGTSPGTSGVVASPPPSLPMSLSRADVIRDLQQYAISIRNIDSHAVELSWYTNPLDRWRHPERVDPFHDVRSNPEKMRAEFELPVPITNFADATADRTRTYQKVRCFAQNMVDTVSFFYGAMSSCLLPVLYALLGAAAYILRDFEQRVRNRTYVPSPSSDSARFLVAGIGGAVVGLFANLTGGDGIKVSPLALAFLVGYAVDVFYAFLESLIRSFTRTVLDRSSTEQANAQVP